VQAWRDEEMNRYAWMPTLAVAALMHALVGCANHEKAALAALTEQGLTDVKLVKLGGGDAWSVTGTKDGQACEGTIRVSSPVGARKPTFESDLKCGSKGAAAERAEAP